MSTAFRNTSKGDTKDLRLTIQELNQQLQDSKNQNRLLGTENARLKKTCDQLSSRLVDVEAGRSTKHGEAATIGALRTAALVAKQQKVEFIANYQQAMDEISSLMSEVGALQQQLAAQQHTEHTLRAALEEAVNDGTARAGAASDKDKQLQALQQQLAATVSELQATKQELSNEQGRRCQAEARLDEVQNHMSSHQDQATVAATTLQGKLAATEQSLTNIKVQMSELDTKVKALQQQLADELQQKNALRGFIDRLQQASQNLSPQIPFAIPLGSDLIPDIKRLAVDSTTNPDSRIGKSRNNNVQVIVHGVSLNQPKTPASGHMSTPSSANTAASGQDQWMMLMYDAPGLSTVTDVVIVSAPGDHYDIGLCHTIRLPDTRSADHDGMEVTKAIATGHVKLRLWSMLSHLVGACRVPIDNDVQPVLVVTCAHGSGTTACKVVSLVSNEGQQQLTLTGGHSPVRPSKVLQTISTDWQGILPGNAAQPSSSQIVVSLRGLHPLLLESLRVSGLFLPGRTFTGTDNQPYQVWDFNTQPARQNATRKYLDMDLTVRDFSMDSSMRPTATLDLPLASALDAPDVTTLHTQHLQQLMQQHPGAGTTGTLHEPCEQNGTISAIMRSPTDAAVATCQVTMRFEKPVPMTRAALAAYATSTPPSQQHTRENVQAFEAKTAAATVSSAAVPRAPALPSSHWGVAMAAELVGAGRLIMELDAAVDKALQACMYQVAAGTSSLHLKQADDAHHIAYVHDVIGRASQLLPAYIASCCDVLRVAELAGEGTTARAWLQSITTALGRLLLATSAKAEYNLHLLTTSLAAWDHIQQVQPANEVPGTAVTSRPFIPNTKQSAMVQQIACALREMTQSLGFQPTSNHSGKASEVHSAAMHVQPADVSAGAVNNHCPTVDAYLAGQVHDALACIMPLTRYLPSDIENTNPSTASKHGDAPTAPTPLALTKQHLKGAISSLETIISDCRLKSSTLISDVNGDYIMYVQSCQESIAACLSSVTIALLDDMHVWARKSAVQRSQHNQDKRLQLLYTVADHVTSIDDEVVGLSTTLNQACTIVLSQLAVELCQLSKVEPTSLPPPPPLTSTPPTQCSAVQWLKASHRLSWQLCNAVSYWMMCAAAVASEMCMSLNVDPSSCVGCSLEALTGEAVRVVQLAQARLIDMQASKVYSQQDIEGSHEVLLGLLSHSLHQACLLPLTTACCILTTPTQEVSLWLSSSPDLSIQSSVHSSAVASVRLRLLGGDNISRHQVAERQDDDQFPSGMDALDVKQTRVVKSVFDCCLWKPKGKVLVIKTTTTPDSIPASLETPSARAHAWAQGIYDTCIRAALAMLGWQYVTLDEYKNHRSTASPRQGQVNTQQPNVAQATNPVVVQQELISPVETKHSQEGRILAAACADTDAVIVLPPSSECGSMISRAQATDTLVLIPDQDSELLKALDACASQQHSITGGDKARVSISSSDDNAVHKLCRLIVARYTSHLLRLSDGHNNSRTSISTPRSNNTGHGHLQRLQPPQVKQLLSAAQACMSKVERAVDSLQASVHTTMLLKTAVSQLLARLQASMLSQHLLYTGLLQALDITFNSLPHPPATKENNAAGGKASSGVKNISAGTGSVLSGQAPSPLQSRASSGVNIGLTRRPSFPAMQRLSGTGASSRGASASGFDTSALPAVQSGSLSEFVAPGVNTGNLPRSTVPQTRLSGSSAAGHASAPSLHASTPSTPGLAIQLTQQQRASIIANSVVCEPGGVLGGDTTESGEFEAGVLPIHIPTHSTKASPGFMRDWDAESDAASVVSSSGYSMSHTRM